MSVIYLRGPDKHFEWGDYIVAYLLKARTVEAGKQPYLGNARTQQ
jgi:hypothetical protein